MDPLSHALSGALLVRAVTPARIMPGAPTVGVRMLAGFVGGAFPDIDVAMRAVDTLWYLTEVHQGATHSLVLLPLWALLLARLLGYLSGLGWRGFFLPVGLGIGVHILADLVTAYGTMVLYPFSEWRLALSWIYVVDPYFTLILLAGLLAAWRWPARARAGSVGALAVLVAYLCMQGFIQYRAVGVAEAHAEASGLPEASGNAVPQPFSPVHRMLLVSNDEQLYVAWTRFLSGRSLPERLPLPGPFAEMARHYSQMPRWFGQARFGTMAPETEFARIAWMQDDFRLFRRFARIPALHEVTVDDALECAWFKDLRFQLPALAPSFVFGMCRSPVDGTWHRERRRGEMWLD